MRGRSFLNEYLRRNRGADTDSLLTAIGRIEELLRSRSLEPDPAATDSAIDAASEPVVPGPDASEFDPSDANRSEAAIVESGGREASPTHDVAPNGMMPLDVAPTENASAEIAEIHVSSVEVTETRASATEFLGPQPKDEVPSAAAERTDKQPRDPFADFYALSSEEKIALFA